MLQLNPHRKAYDVCIIGSGAGGGTAAKVLTEGGLSVVMLEAGPRLDPDKDFKEHVWPYQLPHRGVGIGGKQSGIGNEFMAPNGFWEIDGEPYTTAPGSSFRWFRSRIEGGRTNHWGRIALRFGPADFVRTPPTEWATTGPSPTKNSRLTTTRSNPTSASSAPRKISPTLPTACSCRRPGRAALRPS